MVRSFITVRTKEVARGCVPYKFLMPSARDLAAELLLRLDRKGGRVKDGLERARSRLTDPRERALLTELAYGTVRRRGTLDALIGVFSKRPVPKLNASIRTALRMGTYQLFFLDRVPNHAVVDHAVGWASKHAGARRAGFVNGVIRNLIRGIEGPAAGTEKPRRDVPREDGSAVRMKRGTFADPSTNLAGNLAARYAMPQSLVERWLATFGDARTGQILRTAIARPPLTLRARTDRDALAAALTEREIEHEVGPGPAAVRMQGGEGAIEELLASGLATVQDATSQRVVPLLPLEPGMRVLDLCAAPGGKTLHIADRLGTGTVVACDVEAHKLEGLRALASRMGDVALEVVEVPAEGALPFEPASFDAVLVDAPCTNTGVLARRVEARWRAKPDDAARMAAVQGDILERALPLLKPGGTLVYSTCSIEPEENSGVFETFVARHDDVDGEIAFRAWPTSDHDGGFAAVLRRAAT